MDFVGQTDVGVALIDESAEQFDGIQDTELAVVELGPLGRLLLDIGHGLLLMHSLVGVIDHLLNLILLK